MPIRTVPTGQLRTIIASQMGGPLKFDSWVREHRNEGASWARIASLIYTATTIHVSGESLRGWFTDN